ncbi:DUF1839 family protein [Lichenicola cladoniae]|uniref:DUF1839 family protein n=1 Tax=Lichenicola cladoniae TaxID=1484109 RepID=A0A6M8HFK2_9PROT|nr:DUF1839 family protein [Lichenicola cladoniae]NPD65153.1 DUF1839 family protein [Acetobacteraceae bacterium]QKE88757.1 DUF1839 family protein [Lichenicola cladoniae]
MEREPNTRSFVGHPLHDSARSWPETNCYIDLWIEVLASLGEMPEAAFGFTVLQNFEGDQFTFSKLIPEDLRRLYGLTVQELSVYRTLEDHTALHVGRGEIVLLEVDAFWLPDTAATTYRQVHTKTTIAIDVCDLAAQECGYFHNAARAVLGGDDYLGAFRLRPEFRSEPDLLPPYLETVTQCVRHRDIGSKQEVALDILRGHLPRRPEQNPFSAWRAVFSDHVEDLLQSPERFHDYAFHFPRLAGSNFELLGSHVAWLGGNALQPVVEACERLAQTTKILQFRLARSVARRRPDPCTECFDKLEADYETALSKLAQWAGAGTP